MDYAIGLRNFSYRSKLIDKVAMEQATDEHPFVKESFELLDELLQSVRIVAGLHRVNEVKVPRRMTRNEAILAGLMVRCMKLQEGCIAICEPERMELLLFFQRAITEGAVNLAYLIDHGTPEIFDEFVRFSLRADRGQYDEIQEAIKGSGHEIPIETRILAGIRNSFRRAEVDIASVEAGERGSWGPTGGIYGRFKAIGYQHLYRAFYGMGSHATHGNWHDLLIYHLDDAADGTFEPELRFHNIRPQALLSTTEMLADAAVRYLLDVVPGSRPPAPPRDTERDVLEDRIWLCHKKAREIAELHEGYLQRGAAATPAA